MKKFYSTPELEVITLKLIDVLYGSEDIQDPDIHDYNEDPTIDLGDNLD